MEKRELDAMISPLRGRIGFYYENLIDGTTLGYNEDETFGAASVIKLPVLMYTAKLVAEGELSWEQKVTVRDEDKKPSCGALLSMTGDIETDLISLCRLMITISDNTATNMVIRTVGMERLQKGFTEMGLVKTSLIREMFDTRECVEGLSNLITPGEIGSLLRSIYERSFVSEETSQLIEDILLLQQIRHKIPGYIGRKKKIANKTGEDTGITNDAAIVYAKKPFVMVVTSNDTDVPQTERFIREAALKLYLENGEGE